MTTLQTSFELAPAGTAIPTTGSAGDGDVFTGGANGAGTALVSDQTAGTVAAGSYSAKITTGATAAAIQRSWAITATATPSFRQYVYLTAAPSGAWDFFVFIDAAIVVRARINTGLTLSHLLATAVSDTTTGTIPLNTLVRIEGTWGLSTTGTGTFTLDAYLGHSTTPISNCSLNLTGLTMSAATVATARWGVINAAAANLTAYVDAVGVSDTGRLGPAVVTTATAAGSMTLGGTATGTAGSTGPAIPTGLTATPFSSTQINLSWSSVSGVSAYDIERDGTVIVFGHPLTTYSDTGLGIGTAHTYRVRSVG